MRRPLASLSLLALLAACASPQERCINQATKDLRAVDRLIAETEGNLQRGYALEPTTVYQNVWVPCGYAYGYGYGYGHHAGGMCIEEQARITTRPKAIDLAEEKRKLDQLRGKQAELNRAAKASIQQCQASFPAKD